MSNLKKIECIDALFNKLKCRTELLEFLRDEKLIKDEEIGNLLHELHTTHSSRVFTLLENLQKDEKLQLVSYDWTILPKEFIRLTLVTNQTKKEFTYSV